MNMRSRILLLAGITAVLLVVAGFVVVYNATAQGNAPNSYQLPQRWEYSAKFLCGLSNAPSNPPAEPDVKPGNYATKVNIHNPNAQTVVLLKKVVLANPEGSSQLIPPSKRVADKLQSDWAMSVNCTEIVKLLGQSNIPPPAPFIEGYLVIDAIPAGGVPTPQLDVDAVYTIAPVPNPTLPSSVDGIDVIRIPGRLLPAGVWPF